MPDVGRRTSIRRGVLLSLGGALLLMVAGAAGVTSWIALRTSTDAYDRALLDPALDIAANIVPAPDGGRINLPQHAIDAMVSDQLDSGVYQVRDGLDRIIGGAIDLPPPPDATAGARVFYESSYGRDRMRFVAVRTDDGFVVQVGETLNKRNHLVREFVFAELVSTALIAAAAMALGWYGIRRALSPFDWLRAQILRRSAHDPSALNAGTTPAELRAIVEAFDGLLAQLREANQLQRRFLENTAHQLRTPLAGLQMYLEVLIENEASAAVRIELERMRGATMRANRLVQQLLALARADVRTIERTAPSQLDLAAVGAGAAQQWTRQAIARNVDLGFNLTKAPVSADPAQMTELLDSLIDNALRYTPAGGSVTVSTGQWAGASYLQVEDTGPGIPPSERTNVVERFYRVPGTQGDGSGLGLAIVREIADRHRATLRIDSSAAGGAAVQVIFPKAGADSGGTTTARRQ